MAKKKKPFNKICEDLRLQDYEVAGLITLMNQSGYNIEYIDIDNDENMEIIIYIPVASSYLRFGIYKYEKGGCILKNTFDIRPLH